MPQATLTQSAVDQKSKLDAALIDALLKSEILTEEMFHSIKERSNDDQSMFERMLLNGGYLTEMQLGQLKAQVRNWKFVDLRQAEHSEETFGMLPRTFLMASGTIPYLYKGDMRIASRDPGNEQINQLLRKKFGPDIPVFYATPSALSDVIAKYDTDFASQCERALEQHKKARKTGA